eukprot:8105893-Pyramimonas_sp.AAC.1
MSKRAARGHHRPGPAGHRCARAHYGDGILVQGQRHTAMAMATDAVRHEARRERSHQMDHLRTRGWVARPQALARRAAGGEAIPTASA